VKSVGCVSSGFVWGANGLLFSFVVTFNPEWVAKNPEKAKEWTEAFYERQRQAEERSNQFIDLSSEERKQVLDKADKAIKRMRRFRRLKKVSRRLKSIFSRVLPNGPLE
jgi:ABC-type nitrate/sulfonate/bicarbonate transport system substrate-binding protein